MKEWLTLFAVIGGIILIGYTAWFIGWVLDNWKKVRAYEKLNPKLETLKKNIEEREKKVQYEAEVVNYLVREKSVGFPWLAEAYADFFHLQDLRRASWLESKSRPAPKAADHIREVAGKRRVAEKMYRVLKYQLEYYEDLFPWLVEFKDENIDDLIRQIMEKKEKGGEGLEEPDDAAKKWLTESEYEKLPPVEKYQLALDRYWQKKKSRWEIGRDYERYIGYLYEKSGCNVYYQGIIKGLEDLGRDLITTKGDNIEVIQCKYWSRERTVHEKHIFQLFGTTIEYWLKNTEGKKIIQPPLLPELIKRNKIKATFITTTKLSEKAKEFAAALQVQVIENFPFQRYPSIKCNVSKRTMEKIYHLPFDQQYDSTIVEEERNERYVETVKEAEGFGFRRAFRWKGELLD